MDLYDPFRDFDPIWLWDSGGNLEDRNRIDVANFESYLTDQIKSLVMVMDYDRPMSEVFRNG